MSLIHRKSIKARKHYFQEWKAATSPSSACSLRKRKMHNSDSLDSSPCASKKRKYADNSDSDSDVQIMS